MLRYAITDRRQLAGSSEDQIAALLIQSQRLARIGVDYLQLREKDLSRESLSHLAILVREAIAQTGGPTRLLVNGSVTVAAQAGAHGVHLSAAQGNGGVIGKLQLAREKGLKISLGCHTVEEVERLCRYADLILFAPVYGKQVRGEKVVTGVGLYALRKACEAANDIPVLALGGVTEQNAPACFAAGAAGLAGIRLFQ